ncbi:hypothetical protein [Desulfobacter curvatus]|uniref:hypothetical protein n=1 Tax=Desulfobacter curvatus TaxID=2290 RepID=UPI000360C736|nr:hypothetical protein [Desulfobacter curvatus]
MIRTLITLDKDLASSIALRYACNAVRNFDMALSALHVEDPGPKGRLPGTGWVQRSWETALEEDGRQKIKALIDMENIKFPALGLPKIRIGDKTEETLLEAHTGNYDIFVEGLLATDNTADFHQAVKSQLLRKMPLPSILVKNLIPLESMVLVLTQGHDLGLLMPVLSYFITQSGLPLKVFIWHPHHIKALEFKSAQENANAFFTQVEDSLKNANCPYTAIQAVTGPATLLAKELGPCGLVASVIGHKDLAEDQPCMELLARMESPVMMFWQ